MRKGISINDVKFFHSTQMKNDSMAQISSLYTLKCLVLGKREKVVQLGSRAFAAGLSMTCGGFRRSRRGIHIMGIVSIILVLDIP